MRTRDVMTAQVVSVQSTASIAEAIDIMLKQHFSGLPVTDNKGHLVGIVTEGDFLRRSETGTERRRPRWLEFLLGPGQLAEEYIQSHGWKIEDVMTRDPVTVTEDTPLDEVVRVMERRRVKRVPVIRGDQLVGIISRADLLRALPALVGAAEPSSESDETIRKTLLGELEGQPWAPLATVDITVRNGVVEFRGMITEGAQRDALKVAAENIAGVKAVVVDHLIWIEPTSETVMGWPE